MFTRKISILILVTLFLFTGFLSQCSKDVYVKEVCFEENVLPIFVSKCSMSGCHGASSAIKGKGGRDGNHGYDLTNYDGIMKGVSPKHPNRSSVYSNCSGLFANMPPKNSEQMTKEELSTIKSWINMGAPNSSNCNGTSCDTSLYSYSMAVAPLFKTNCVGCHSSSNKSGNVDLTSYSATLESVQSHNLLNCVKHTTGYSPMPPSITMNACAISKIEKWVQHGAKND